MAPENYGLLLFPPADNRLLDELEKQNKITPPKLYRNILHVMNGCFIYGLSLYGLPMSLYTTGSLNRRTLNQFDLGTANKFWKHEYDAETEDLFHIGGRAYSFHENIGYFVDNENKIISLRKTGEQIKSWTKFRDFLSDEISEAEDMMLEEVPKALWKK